eukprot:2487735-Prymnesium_polylepis.1
MASSSVRSSPEPPRRVSANTVYSTTCRNHRGWPYAFHLKAMAARIGSLAMRGRTSDSTMARKSGLSATVSPGRGLAPQTTSTALSSRPSGQKPLVGIANAAPATAMRSPPPASASRRAAS